MRQILIVLYLVNSLNIHCWGTCCALHLARGWELSSGQAHVISGFMELLGSDVYLPGCQKKRDGVLQGSTFRKAGNPGHSFLNVSPLVGSDSAPQASSLLKESYSFSFRKYTARPAKFVTSYCR